jgi:hypothetical protein
MPTPVSRALLALSLAAFFVALVPSGASAADDVVAKLRVVAASGAELDSGAAYVTNTEKIKTDKKAKCFIDGQGGSGDKVKLPGPTAMGLLETAGDLNPSLDPLSATDEFGFGLGLCGIGEEQATTDDFWSVTLNHQAAQVGGDQLALEDEDEVLWSLTTFPPPNELELRVAPGTATGDVGVTVVEWTCSTTFPPPDPVCTESPAEGATVGGAGTATTDSEGQATLTMSAEGTYTLRATQDGRLDSNAARVCVSDEEDVCPDPADPHGLDIFGRAGDDEFSGTEGWDTIKARGGRDVIDLTEGGSDAVNCGGGKDKVVRYDIDENDAIADNCEKVKRLVP